MTKERYVEFDLLRALIIVSAFLLHYNDKIHVGFLAQPSFYVQFNLFTVGSFFFFTAGYMAKKVYLAKYKADAISVSRRIFKKGLSIIVLYVLYVFLMHIFTMTHLPNSLMMFIYDHRFYTKVLFTFSLLYMMTPLILFVVTRLPRTSMLLTIVLTISCLFYNQNWSIPYALKKTFFDRNLFVYSFIPSLVVYSAGYLFAANEKLLNGKSPKVLALAAYGILTTHVLLNSYISWYSHFVGNLKSFLFVEIVAICLIVIIARYIMSISSLRIYLNSVYVICIGVFSLHFYVISNIFLGLLWISNDSTEIIKIIGLLGVGSLTYLFTYWRFKSSYAKTPIKHSSDNELPVA